MKRLFFGVLAVGLVAVAVAISGNQQAGNGSLQIQTEARNPWTHLRLNDDPDTFHFVVVSDRTGGHRARIFSQAVEQINLLQPAFVISVGDLIGGYTSDKKRLADEWKEFQTFVARLQMPFFYAPGNHDLANEAQEKEWKERFGRSYYHFLFKNTLFLMLNSDDPFAKDGKIGPEQIEFVKKTVQENKNVRWIFVSLHKPLWSQANLEKTGWLEVEKALEGRSYTVFAGHLHIYQKYIRQGQNYYQLATTGGSSKVRGLAYNEFDHLAWVTMKKDSPPILANLMLDGIYPEDLKRPISDEAGSIRYGRKPTQWVSGKVLFEGAPIPNARVDFHLSENEGQKLTRTSDALVEADGSFTLSTYQPNDGAPTGDYVVTVTWREFSADRSKIGPNRLPDKYSKAATSDLKAKVKTGTNEFSFNLSK